jgi:hypothetical protein
LAVIMCKKEDGICGMTHGVNRRVIGSVASRATVRMPNKNSCDSECFSRYYLQCINQYAL